MAVGRLGKFFHCGLFLYEIIRKKKMPRDEKEENSRANHRNESLPNFSFAHFPSPPRCLSFNPLWSISTFTGCGPAFLCALNWLFSQCNLLYIFNDHNYSLMHLSVLDLHV